MLPGLHFAITKHTDAQSNRKISAVRSFSISHNGLAIMIIILFSQNLFRILHIWLMYKKNHGSSPEIDTNPFGLESARVSGIKNLSNQTCRATYNSDPLLTSEQPTVAERFLFPFFLFLQDNLLLKHLQCFSVSCGLTRLCGSNSRGVSVKTVSTLSLGNCAGVNITKDVTKLCKQTKKTKHLAPADPGHVVLTQINHNKCLPRT